MRPEYLGSIVHSSDGENSQDSCGAPIGRMYTSSPATTVRASYRVCFHFCWTLAFHVSDRRHGIFASQVVPGCRATRNLIRLNQSYVSGWGVKGVGAWVPRRLKFYPSPGSAPKQKVGLSQQRIFVYLMITT